MQRSAGYKVLLLFSMAKPAIPPRMARPWSALERVRRDAQSHPRHHSRGNPCGCPVVDCSVLRNVLGAHKGRPYISEEG